MLNFDRSTVKHGTQNIQNDCHQWLSDSIRVHKFVFGPHWGSLQRPSDSLAGLKDPTSKWRGEGKEREKGGERERKGPAPVSQIAGSAPDCRPQFVN